MDYNANADEVSLIQHPGDTALHLMIGAHRSTCSCGQHRGFTKWRHKLPTFTSNFYTWLPEVWWFENALITTVAFQKPKHRTFF